MEYRRFAVISGQWKDRNIIYKIYNTKYTQLIHLKSLIQNSYYTVRQSNNKAHKFCKVVTSL